MGMSGSAGESEQAEEAKWWFDINQLDVEDISLARVQAEKRGLKYETYLKMLIHDALQWEDKATS